jgi:hypothetical protein
MKEPHREGIAIHSDPESCASSREGAGEALTGAHAGRQDIERRNPFINLGAVVVLGGARHHRGLANAIDELVNTAFLLDFQWGVL